MDVCNIDTANFESIKILYQSYHLKQLFDKFNWILKCRFVDKSIIA